MNKKIGIGSPKVIVAPTWAVSLGDGEGQWMHRQSFRGPITYLSL